MKPSNIFERIRSRKTAAAIIIVNLVCGGLIVAADTKIAAAGWMDSWVQGNVKAEGTYSSDGKRAYVTAPGSYSARFKNSTDRLMTVQAPHLKGGCGGIDLFTGSLSYLNFDFIVQKMQNILAAAPAAAFDLALNTLCTPCAQTMKAMTAVTDVLNNTQINDCQASKALIATVVAEGNLSGRDTEMDKRFGRAADEAMQRSGMSSFWTGQEAAKAAVIKAGQSWTDWGSMFSTTPASMFAGCPQDVKDFIPVSGSSKSMVHEMADKIGLLDYEDIIRSIVGDIVVYGPETGLKTSFIKGCDENNDITAEQIAKGELWIIDNWGTVQGKLDAAATAGFGPVTTSVTIPDRTCSKSNSPAPTGGDWALGSSTAFTNPGKPSADLVSLSAAKSNSLASLTSNWNIQGDMKVRLLNIVEKMTYKQNLDAADEAFIARMYHTPVLITLKAAIMSRSVETVIDTLSESMANNIAYYLFRDLSVVAQKLSGTLSTFRLKEIPINCAIGAMTQSLDNDLQLFKASMDARKKAIIDGHKIAQDKLVGVMQYINSNQTFMTLAESRLKEQFSSGVALRAFGGVN